FLLAVLAGVVATLAALALTGLSGWLIVRASQQPPILYLLVAIVGVRFFGLMRAVARYAERLWLHDAVFSALTRLRVRVWEALSVRVLSRRSLLRGEGAVDHLIGDLDAVRDLAPRALLPPLAGMLAAVGVLTTTALLLPQAVALELAVLAGAVLLAPATALLADRAAGRAEQRHRSAVVRTVAALLNAAGDLRVNRAEGRLLHRLQQEDQGATAAVKRSVRAQGLAQGLLVLFSSLGALGMLTVGAPAVAAGTLPAEVLAALVLLNLALADALAPVTAAVQLWPALDTVLVRFAPDLLRSEGRGLQVLGAEGWGPGARASEPSATELPGTELPADGAALELTGVRAIWPDSPEPVFSGLSTTVRPGEWLTVSGPSGSGKSTLLAVMLGFLKPASGQFRARGRIAWCPQQGHLFDSTLRANLLLARPRSQAPTEAQLHKVLDDVGLGPLLAALPRGLDTRLGPEGSHLSGGQRQRVAVARTLLAGADVLLLDEPTAHLDTEAARALMRDLRRALSSKTVVLVTHDDAAREPGDTKLVLG
ncbi:MAG TPA: thiol reductant ABC exporter subunit CydC, partial [Micrococcaceae bacterium]|nr:thiol reductant ABC exporter subunit CydC [Micrococcaceae bacterium]